MAHLNPIASIVATLQRDNIIPDVLPDTFEPSVLLSIVFPNGKEVSVGEELCLEDTLEEPNVSFVPLNIPLEQACSDEDVGGGKVGYTLAMLDPDAPSRAEPLYKNFRHWLVSLHLTCADTRILMHLQITGLKSPETTSNSVTGPTALKSQPPTTPYRPPGPRPGSGLHRYSPLSILCLFQGFD